MAAKLSGAVDDRVAAWEACGAMALCGRPDGPPLGPPAPLVPRLRAIGDVLEHHGGAGMPDVLRLLAERAVLLGLRRGGNVSCSGSTRLLRSWDGWVAVTLARPEDNTAAAAWLECDADPADPWPVVAGVAPTRRVDELVGRATLLGLPVAALAEARPQAPAPAPFDGLPIGAVAFGDAGRHTKPFTVVELGSLWAGPLCGRLLRLAGGRVLKVESRSRPDGARDHPVFYERMNDGKDEAVVDLAELPRILAQADVVIEASRPRALQQLGIVAEAILGGQDGPAVWVSITGHGRGGEGALRVAFGDDAAVGGGLVVWDQDGPCFCADAIADPLSGIVAAAASLAALRSGRRWLLDVSMSAVASHFAGVTLPI